MPDLNYVQLPPDPIEMVFTPNSVLESLNSFKSSKAVGPDGFSAFFYKEIKYEICKPLSLIFSLSFNTGVLPTCWKISHVIPIYKKGNAADPVNYRPIALTSLPCRIMEKIIKKNMLNHISLHNILRFISGRSTTLQLLKALDDWTTAIDDGIPTDVVFIDFAKAFESVSHRKLLHKLKGYCFNNTSTLD